MTEHERPTRRRYLQLVSAGGVAGLAGCGGVLDDSDSEDDGSSDDAGSGNPDSDDESPNDDTESRTEESLTIGHVGPEGNPLGVGSVRAAAMAVEEVNADGGVAGAAVELITGDTAASPAEAQTVVEEMISQDGADVIVGGFAGTVTRAVIELTGEFEVPYLSTAARDPRLSTDFVDEEYEENRHYFRVGPLNAELQTEAMRDYAVHLSDRHGWNSLSFYFDDAAWTQVYADQLPGLLQNAGLDIEVVGPVPIDNPDLSSLIRQTREEGADYILRFFAHVQNSPAQLLAPWHEAQYDFGIEGVHVAGMHPELDELTEGVCVYEGTGQYGGGGVAPITENTLEFTQSYRNRYAGEDSPRGSPMYMGLVTYDAIHLVASVLDGLGTTTPADRLDDYVDAMLGAEFTGITSEISFYDRDGEFPHDLRPTRNGSGEITNYPFTQWQPAEGDRPGSVECVYPVEYQTADHLQPAWME